jgi:hypothetical protein
MLPLRERGYGQLTTFFVTVGVGLYVLFTSDAETPLGQLLGAPLMAFFAYAISSWVFQFLKIR